MMKTGTQEHLSRLELARCPTRSLLRTQLYLYLRNPISSILSTASLRPNFLIQNFSPSFVCLVGR